MYYRDLRFSSQLWIQISSITCWFYATYRLYPDIQLGSSLDLYLSDTCTSPYRISSRPWCVNTTFAVRCVLLLCDDFLWSHDCVLSELFVYRRGAMQPAIKNIIIIKRISVYIRVYRKEYRCITGINTAKLIHVTTVIQSSMATNIHFHYFLFAILTWCTLLLLLTYRFCFSQLLPKRACIIQI